MNKPLRLFSLLACLSVASWAPAQSQYGYLTLKQSDGSEYSLAAQGLKLTFTNGTLTLIGADGLRTFPLGSMASMRFTATPTAIDAVSADGGSLRATLRGGVLAIQGATAPQATLYDAQGCAVANVALTKEGSGQCAVAGLAPGVYVLRTLGQTLKIRIQ